MRRPFFAFLTLVCLTLPWAPWSAAAGAAETPERHMEVVQVQGAIDPVVAELITSSVRRADTNGATVVVLQMDSPGALDTAPEDFLGSLGGTKVPIVVWVGQGKATARGLAALLVSGAAFSAASPGATIGPLNPLRLDRTGERAGPGGVPVRLQPGQPAPFAGPKALERYGKLLDRRYSGRAAAAADVIDMVAPTLGDLIIGLNGTEVPTAAGPVRLTTAKEVNTKDGPRQTVDQPVRFIKLGTFASVQHSLTSPSVVFLLLIVGLSLMVFEFFTVGIGLAGATGAAAVAGALYGSSHLPITWWALGLLLLSTFGFAVDVQAGRQGFWTGMGAITLLAGALTLFGGSAALNVPLWLVVLIFVLQVVFMLGGMTVAVRNRFSIPTVGRDSMIGELGEARTELNPDGVVTVRGAPWRARTHRGTPVSPGGSVRVVAVDRLVLEVEPGDAPVEV